MRGIDAKPYLEWLDGVESVAVSPNTPHGIVATTRLPDVTFYRNETLLALDPKDRLLPNVPPEVIVEVRSPDDRPGFREEKIRRYRAWGCPVVLDVDPSGRTIVVHSDAGVRALGETDRFSDPAVPWLSFDVAEAFARLALFGF